MARAKFGGRLGDTVVSLYDLGTRKVYTQPVDAAGFPAAVVLTVWSAQVGGVQLTDLRAADGVTPITQVVVPVDGQVPVFYGPEGLTEVWLQDPEGDRARIDVGPTGITGSPGAPGTPGTGSVNLPELARNLVLNPRPVTGVAHYESNGVVARTQDTDPDGAQEWWVTAPSGQFTYFSGSGATTGRYYAARFLVKGTPGVVFDVGSSDFVVGAFTSAGAYTIPASGFLWIDLPSAAPTAGPNLYFGAIGSSTGTIKLTRGIVVEVSGPGHLAPGFFDGASTGGYWTGTAYASASIKGVPKRDDVDLLVWLDAGRARGVGSPEGRIAAPIGTEYKDTAATTGAIKWIKAEGTGNTGWRVVYGDTGWRNVSELLVHDFVLDAVIGACHVRRSGDQVTMRMRVALKPTAVDGSIRWNIKRILSLPLGFRASVNYGSYGGILVGGEPGILGGLGYGNTSVEASVGDSSVPWAASDGVAGEVTVMTSDPWPTTMPGIPA